MASQISRIFFIDRQIRLRGNVTLSEIMDEGNVSIATAKRDIEFLRYTIDAPIIYDKKLKAYIYKKEFTLLGFAGEQLFLFYIMARGLLDNYNYLPLTAEYARKMISDKINEILPEEYRKLSYKFGYFYSDYEQIDFGIFEKITMAMKENRLCRISYLTKGKNESVRKIAPIKAVCYGAKWYLIAFCRRRKALRIFSFSRINKIELLDETFEAEAYEKNGEILFEESFGIARGDKLRDAEIKFYDPASYYVRNQIWHPAQQTELCEENGALVLTMRLPYSKAEELIGKVLKYGANAEILSPATLRKQWLGEIEKMYEKFGENKK